MSVKEKLTAIADKIRTHLATENKYSLDEMVQGVEEVYYNAETNGYSFGFQDGEEAGYKIGKQAQYDVFWDAYQQKGTRIYYQYAFAGRGGWAKNVFKPKYDMTPANANSMFDQFFDVGTVDLRNIGVNIDFSNCVAMIDTFANAASIVGIGIFDSRKSDALPGTFRYSGIQTIEKLILKSEGSQTFVNTFANATALKNIFVEGVIGNSISFSACPLTKSSIKSVVNALSTTTTGKTLTLKKSAVDTAFERIYAASYTWDVEFGADWEPIVWANVIGDVVEVGEYVYISGTDTNIVIQKTGDSIDPSGFNEGEWTLIDQGPDVKNEWGDLIASKSNWTISLV